MQGVGLSYAVAGGVAGDPSRHRDLIHGIAGQAGLPGVTGDLRAAGGQLVGEFQATPGREPAHPLQPSYLGHQLPIGPRTQIRGRRIRGPPFLVEENLKLGIQLGGPLDAELGAQITAAAPLFVGPHADGTRRPRAPRHPAGRWTLVDPEVQVID